MSDCPAPAEAVRQMAAIIPAARTPLLQVWIGGEVESPRELQKRAEVVTALREARLWPDGCPGVGRVL